MLRDSAPIHSLGHGVTSRDVPLQEGETEGPSPNSGYIANALNGNPVMRFFAHTATSMVVAGVLGRMVKSGGLKLGKYLQDNADANLPNKFSSRAVKSAIDIRKALDELQGVERHIGDQDAYSKLVFEQDGRLTTGYLGKTSERFRFNYMTEAELNQAALERGLTGEPPVVWSWRDELQKRLVRSGRRLPYELPAMYAGQRAVTDTLFGTETNEPQVKWYNPVDVVADFTKQSLINISTAIVPFEFAGAGVSNAKSSVRTLKFSMDEMRSLTPMQKKMSKHYVNLENLLSEVGHDVAGLTNRFLRLSAQTSGALAAATEEYQNRNNFVQNLSSLRHGFDSALQANRNAQQNKSKAALNAAKDTFFKRNGNVSGLDLLPGMGGATRALAKGKEEFKLTGKGYDALESAIAYNKVLNEMSGTPEPAQTLKKAMHRVQEMHSSRLSRFAAKLDILGRGGPGSAEFTKSDFFIGQQKAEMKKLIESELVGKGLSDREASRLVGNLSIGMNRPGTNNTNMVTIGKSRILPTSGSTDQAADDFFNQILTRFKQDTVGSDVYSKLAQGGGSPSSALQDAVDRARAAFTDIEFKTALRNKIARQWNSFYGDSLLEAGETVLKPIKGNYQEFMGPLSSAKQEFLQKRTAETLGIKLLRSDGRRESLDVVRNNIRDRGIDPNNFASLRNFLMDNKKLNSGVFSGGFNIFSSRPLLVEEAQSSGLFSFMPPGQQRVVQDLAARMATQDPIRASSDYSAVRGIYETRGGRILDLSAVKTTFANAADFLATQFKIPVLGFNPADMFGYKSFSEMAKRAPFQYIPGGTVQPFAELAESRADFYTWHSRGGFRGSKGVVTAYSADQMAGSVYGKTLSGTYRPVPTKSSEMITRHARFAAGLGGQTIDEIKGAMDDPRSIVPKLKSAFSVDSEQPNSLFRVYRKFRDRKTDLFNESVMAKLLTGQEIDYKSSGSVRKVRLSVYSDNNDLNKIGIIDRDGNLVNSPAFSEENIIRGYHNLRKQTYFAGFNKQIMEQLEEMEQDLFTFSGTAQIRASKLSGSQELREAAETLIATSGEMADVARSGDFSELAVYGPLSRMERILRETDLSAASPAAYKSTTITTRAEELRKEIFSYIYESNQIRRASQAGSGNLADPFLKISEAVEDLVKRRVITPSQKTEAQAAALSGLFNLSAFKTYRDSSLNIQNERDAIASLFEAAGIGTNPEIKNLFNPFRNGQIDFLGTPLRQKFSPLLGGLKTRFSTSNYEMDPLSMDPLGTGQDITLVPTFGTVYGRDKRGAIKSAMGLTTYSDPGSFSTASVPISHSVERLNKYFGTLGLSLDVNKYAGPLDLFARGMVMKRAVPAYALGTSFMTVDRTIGGMIEGEDERGERIYAPLIAGTVARGIVEAQSLAAGMIPGGMSYEEKREQLLEGEVPIRQGRFWPLGNTPFEGGKIMYYRPSWYRKLQAGSAFTSDTYGSPVEKFLFYNDISPLRPLDPYRFERKHYQDRPYPVTGEYFSGPFGPLVPFANMTIGKILKPQVQMHEQEVAEGLASYVPAGEFGAYDAAAYVPRVGIGGMGSMSSGGQASPMIVSGQGYRGLNQEISNTNLTLASRAGATNLASGMTTQAIGSVNAGYAQMAYGPPSVRGVMSPEIVPSGAPIQPSALPFQFGEFGYRSQEMLGIYGFASASLREGLGFGQGDFEPQRAVMQSATTAYSSSREFWDLNLGGLGDVPLSTSGPFGSIEFSEIVRRFIPKERNNVDYINPIRNTMGFQYPFLPGPEYFTDFTRGDPFTKVSEGIIRLPGVAYERLNTVYSDDYGKYGALTQYDILADVAPYSQQFKQLDKTIDMQLTEPDQKIRLQEIRSQLEQTTKKYQFSEYRSQGPSREELGMPPTLANISRVGEMIAHSDNFLVYKAFGQRNATEDWERSNVYGTSFPEWQRPFESYIEPMIYGATQKNPLIAAASLGTIGSFFGRTAPAKFLGTAVGVIAGGSAGAFGQAYELTTGDRFVPLKEKQRIALEEYTDILNYTKSTRLAKMAEMSGDAYSANQYRMDAQRTMYGADLYSGDIERLSLAVPKRKREHFMEMLQAPEPERERILSTAGRLERRLYQAAWGMEVERKPDLVEYFSRHELPDASWEGWHPNTNMDHVKIKTGQSMGIEMSQMGYYPQQIKQANLTNPSYPQFGARTDNQDAAARIRQLLSGMGISGTVSPILSPYSNGSVSISAGAY